MCCSGNLDRSKKEIVYKASTVPGAIRDGIFYVIYK